MSLVPIVYAAACALIVSALVTAVRRRPVGRVSWSIIASVVQMALVPAAELVRATGTDRWIAPSAASVELFSLLFPALVWMNLLKPESGIARSASVAAASIIACAGIILVFDPFLVPLSPNGRVQFLMFRTPWLTLVTITVCAFMLSSVLTIKRRVRMSRSRAERRRLLLTGAVPAAYPAVIIAAGYAFTDPFAYACAIGASSVAAAFMLIFIVADRPLPVHLSAFPADLMYAAASAIVYSVSFAALDIGCGALAAALGRDTLVWNATLIVCAGLLFWPVFMRIEKILQRIFYRDVEKIRALFFEYTERARHMTSIEAITEAFCSYLEDAFNVSRCEVFLLDDAASAYSSVQQHERSFSSKGSLAGLCSGSGDPRSVADLIGSCADDEQRILREYEKGTVVPVLFGARISAYLLVGPRLTGRLVHHGAAFSDLFTPAVQALSFIVDRYHLIEQLRRDEVRFAQEDRLAMLGTFGAGIAHELRNPLNVISTSAQTILRKPHDIDMHTEVARFIADESIRMSHTIDEFLRFSKSNTPEWKNDDLRTIIDNALRPLQPKIESRRVRVNVSVPAVITRVVTSTRHLEHALGNIMQNAVDAMEPGGALTVLVEETTPGRLSIRIQDTGPGIPNEVIDKIFDPFFTTKTEGTGLGLPIVRMILSNIGAAVSASSTQAGAEFVVSLPVDGRIRDD
ncbi:MAG TPA: ATP-binding protein [Bacteroidota bacterium]|nr:ATP-binding protein [Bacteroidota bacterium]